MSKTIKLTGQKALEIFMHPLRQKILRHMSIVDVPMTAKQVADAMKITPSSAKHHLDQLRSLGLVEKDHDEIIRGITAHYLRLTDVSVQIGGELQDELEPERSALMWYILNQTFNNFQENAKKIPKGEHSSDIHGDLLSGVMHLTSEEFKELYQLTNDFIYKHRHPRPNTISYEYVLLCNKVGDLYEN